MPYTQQEIASMVYKLGPEETKKMIDADLAAQSAGQAAAGNGNPILSGSVAGAANDAGQALSGGLHKALNGGPGDPITGNPALVAAGRNAGQAFAQSPAGQAVGRYVNGAVDNLGRSADNFKKDFAQDPLYAGTTFLTRGLGAYHPGTDLDKELNYKAPTLTDPQTQPNGKAEEPAGEAIKKDNRNAGPGGPSASSQFIKQLGEYQKRNDASFEDDKTHTGTIAQLQADGYAAASKLQDDAIKKREDDLLKQENDWNAIQQKNAERDQAIRDRIAEIKDIDPNQFWKNAGIAGSIGAAISIGLGAFGSGVSAIHGQATPNTAMQLINQAIVNNIDAQKSNIEKQWKQVEQTISLNDREFARNAFMHKEKADLSSVSYGLVKDKIQSLMNLTDSKVVKERGQMMINEIERQENKLRIESQQMMYNVRKKDETEAAAAARAKAEQESARRFEIDKLMLQHKNQMEEDDNRARGKKPKVDVAPMLDASGHPQNGGVFSGDGTGVFAGGRVGRTLASGSSDMSPAARVVRSGLGLDAASRLFGVKDPQLLRQQYDAYNGGVDALAKVYRDPEKNQTITKAYKIYPWMSDEEIRQRQAGFKYFMETYKPESVDDNDNGEQ